jgi:membrane protein DedA with SNARE-associated domain
MPTNPCDIDVLEFTCFQVISAFAVLVSVFYIGWYFWDYWENGPP